MQFSFLGTSYNHEPLTIETLESEISGKFMGKTYQIRRSVVAKPHTQRNLKYRGVAY